MDSRNSSTISSLFTGPRAELVSPQEGPSARTDRQFYPQNQSASLQAKCTVRVGGPPGFWISSLSPVKALTFSGCFAAEGGENEHLRTSSCPVPSPLGMQLLQLDGSEAFLTLQSGKVEVSQLSKLTLSQSYINNF